MTKYYKNFKELIEDNPENIYSKSHSWAERPEGGWCKSGNDSFIGIADHGTEGFDFSEQWYRVGYMSEEEEKSGILSPFRHEVPPPMPNYERRRRSKIQLTTYSHPWLTEEEIRQEFNNLNWMDSKVHGYETYTYLSKDGKQREMPTNCSVGECKNQPIQLLTTLENNKEYRCENHYYILDLDKTKYKSKEKL